MGGSWWKHNGGASNYLCLPMNPSFGKFERGSQGGNYIYGAEYQHTRLASKPLVHYDATCVVCHIQSRGSYVMIPARNTCPNGWSLEYKGYLMSAHSSHIGRTQFLCVDKNAEARAGSKPDVNGALLYLVESSCGSLPCPPYSDGIEINCVVCTK